MKNQKGITLIALIMTIILIIVLAGIGTYTGIESFNNMRVQAFVTKMIAIQEKVDVFCDQYSVSEINAMSFPPPTPEAETVLNTVIGMGTNGKLKSWFTVDETPANYKYLDTNAIETILGIKDFDVAIWLNPTTRNVIAVKGVEVDEVKYYRQYDLSGGQTLAEPLINSDPSLSVTVKTYDNKADLKLPKQFSKIILNIMPNITATTPTSSKTFAHTDTITVTESGIYQITATDYDKMETMDKRSDNISVTIVNKPMLVAGLTPIDEDGNDVTDLKGWYNYDATAKKWANARAKDNSVYVWIPRFAYNKNGANINVKFMSDISSSICTDGSVATDYKVAPAFQSGVSNGFQHGEWDNEITGFWVAKYEATLNTLSGVTVPKSVPSTAVASVATPKNAFIYCRNMESITDIFTITRAETLNMTNETYGTYLKDSNNIDTHLMKNSEYAAVAYLTYSNYGMGSTITAQASSYPGYISGTTLSADSTTTTGNKTGVYGIMGGPHEMTAAGYTIDNNFNKSTNSTKYATTYFNEAAVTVNGDGIADTPFTLNSSNNTKPSNATTRNFLRGGSNSNGQIFGYNAMGDTDTAAFRPVVIIEY